MAKAGLIGADVGGSNTRLVIQHPGELSRVLVVPTPQASEPEGFVDQLGDRIVGLTQGVPVAAAAFGFAGAVSQSHVYSAANIPAFADAARVRPVPLAEMLFDRTGIPTAFGNDANLAALGEYARGAGQGGNPMVYVTWSTGVGAGVVIGGRLFTGATGAAAESGHEVADPASEMTCGLGHRGDVEAIAGGESIRRRAVRVIAAGEPSSLLKHSISAVTTDHVFAEARLGDPIAGQIVDDAARAMGVLVANIINTWNPSVVVVGGGVIKSVGKLAEGGGVWSGVMRFAQRYVTSPGAWTACHFRDADLDEPGLVGALALAQQRAEEA